MANNVVEILQGVVGELKDMARSESIIGEAITIGDKTVIPVVKISVGFGAGGGQGEHRADKYIVEYLGHCCREMSAMPRILVSDDRDLRAKAAEFGARYMPVPQFGAFLQEMQA